MLEPVEYHQLRIGQLVGYELIQLRVATAIEFGGQHQCRMFDGVQPRAHLGAGVDVEHAQEHVFRCIEYGVEPDVHQVPVGLEEDPIGGVLRMIERVESDREEEGGRSCGERESGGGGG